MGAYIARRLLLVIPTLLGILVINFAMVQFVILRGVILPYIIKYENVFVHQIASIAGDICCPDHGHHVRRASAHWKQFQLLTRILASTSQE